MWWQQIFGPWHEKNYIHNYVNNKRSIRETRNLKTIDSCDQKLTHSDPSHVVTKLMGKEWKTTRTHFWAVNITCDDRFLGRDMTGKKWDCHVALQCRVVCSMCWVVHGMKNLFRRPWWRGWEDSWAWVGIIWLSRSSAATLLRLTPQKLVTCTILQYKFT